MLGASTGCIASSFKREYQMANDLFFFPAFSTCEPPWKLLARMQIETMALVIRRAQAYLELPQTLAQCRTPDDLMTEQVRFSQIAQRQYMAAGEQMFGILPMPSLAETSKTQEVPTKPRDYMVVLENESAVPAKEPAKAPVDDQARQRIRRSA